MTEGVIDSERTKEERTLPGESQEPTRSCGSCAHWYGDENNPSERSVCHKILSVTTFRYDRTPKDEPAVVSHGMAHLVDPSTMEVSRMDPVNIPEDIGLLTLPGFYCAMWETWEDDESEEEDAE